MAQKALFHKLTFCVGGTLIISILIFGHMSMDKTIFSENIITKKLEALKSKLTVFTENYYGNISKGIYLF